MAKQTVSPVTPAFKDVDKEATARAQAALAGGNQEPLKAPKSAKVSTDKKGVEYRRWSERVVVQSAYRTTTKTGLLDVVVIAKIRQSEEKENTGRKVFGHGYLNTGELKDGHEGMNDRTNGYMISLLVATGFMPAGGTLRGSLLDKMFPAKSQPGTASPLNSKSVVANIVQTYGPQKDKNKKPVLGADGKPIMERRDSIESFLPEVAPVTETETEDEE